MERASSVRIVTSAARSTLFRIVTENFTPLGLCPCHISFTQFIQHRGRTCRRYLADMAMASVRVGKAAPVQTDPF